MGSRSKHSGRARKRRPSSTGAGPSLHRAVPGAAGAVDVDLRDAALQRVAQQRTKAVAKGLRDRSVRGLHCVVLDAYDDLDRMHGELDLSPPVACCRGCSHCCWNQVSLTPAEALYLGFHLLETCSQERLAEISRRIDQVLGLIAGKTRQEMASIRHETPCPLLLDDACSVHPARPLVCRGWNSVNVESCRLSIAERDPMRMIENHALLRDLADAVQTGLLQGTSQLGLEAGYLVITRALRLMLDCGVVECAADWLEGKPFFGRPRTW